MRHFAVGALILVAVSCGTDDSGEASNVAGSGGVSGNAGWPDGSAGSAGTAPDATTEGPPPKPALGNALHLDDGSVHPLYPVSDVGASTRAVAYSQNGALVTALDEAGGVLWEKDLGAGALFGGFDFDADGWPDLGLVRTELAGGTCGTTPLQNTRLDVARGKDGALFALTAATPAKCWTFPSATYPTDQWTTLGISFGSGSTLVLSEYYATTGSFVSFDGNAFTPLGSFVYPSTASYDSTYLADQPNAWGQPNSYLENSHVANGLVAETSSGSRFVMFTSGRVVEYAVEAQGPGQLLHDTPFVTGNRTDLAGRNYGLVALDPGSLNTLVLLSGTSVDTVFEDMQTGTLASDPWGGIERHITVYDLETRALDDRFFSYAHDNGDGNQYEGRVVAPSGPFVRLGSSQKSRLAFNVYQAGHWILHVTAPGTTTDAVTFSDLFLWDISDLDGDGVDEWLLSPSRDPEEPDVPGYYFVKWRTRIAHWDEASLGPLTLSEHQGAIPLLHQSFRTPTRTSSRSFLTPALTVGRQDGLVLLLSDSAKTIVELPL